MVVEYVGENEEARLRETQSDGLGYFLFTELPARSLTINIRKGPYARQFEVEAIGGTTRTLERAMTCFEPDAASIAVFGGSYDAIDRALDELGFEYTFFDVNQHIEERRGRQ